MLGTQMLKNVNATTIHFCVRAPAPLPDGLEEPESPRKGSSAQPLPAQCSLAMRTQPPRHPRGFLHFLKGSATGF